MGFKAGNNQYFLLFRVAGKAQWRTSQVNNLLDNLGLVATPYMDHPKIIGFTHNDMDNHEFVKLIKQSHSSKDADRFHWVSDSTASKVYQKLAANLSVPIMASEGSQRERKAPERLQMIEEPKKHKRQEPSSDKVQYMTESDEEPVAPPAIVPTDEEVAARLVGCREKALDDFVPEKRARLDNECDIEAYATREEMEEIHMKDLNAHDEEVLDNYVTENVAKTLAGIRSFVCEHLKFAQGKKLVPDDIYDRYDRVCGVLSRNVLRRYLNRVVLAEIPGATYGTSVFGGRKTGFGHVELVAVAPETVTPVVQATVPDLPVAAPPGLIDPAAGEPEQPVVKATYMPNFAAVYSEANVELKRLEAHLVDKDKQIADKDKHLADKDKHLVDKDKHLADKDAEIKRMEAHLAEKDRALKGALAALAAISNS